VDRLVRNGDAEPAINDFVISDFAGNDSTQYILNHPGYTFLFMVKDVHEAGTGWRKKISRLQSDCQGYGVKLYGITASGDAEAEQFKQANGLTFTFLQMDATVIKTAARTNPCLILLKQGTIVGKWSYRDIPVGAIPSPDRKNINLKF
jgi:hypothetical protein